MAEAADQDRPAQAAVPRLARGVRLHWCRVRETWFLLGPERAIRLDATGHAVLDLVDGTRDLGAIATTLAERFDAPAAKIEADAGAYLAGLSDRGLVRLGP